MWRRWVWLTLAASAVGAISAQAQLVLRWRQTIPPPVDSYVLTNQQTPIATWPASEATPEQTPNQFQHLLPPAVQYGDVIQLQACNTGGCSDLSNIWPTPTWTVSPTLTATPTSTATVTPTTTPSQTPTVTPQRPAPPLILELYNVVLTGTPTIGWKVP